MKHRANRRRMSNKKFIAILSVFVMLALTMVVGCAVDGTVAWLVSESESSVSTFTLGDINIKLTGESESQPLKIIPGVEIRRSLKVTVEPNSEACWLFVKVEEAGTFVTDKVTYSIDTGWTKLTGVTGVDNVYYREVGAVTADTDFAVLKDNKVTVSDTLTKEDIQNITNPTLTFTAYAVQKDGFNTAAAAWAEASK